MGCEAWRGGREGSEFFDRAQPDAVSLAKSTIDGARLGNAHLGPADQGRHVRGIGIAVADESLRVRPFIYSGLEDPSIQTGVGEAAIDRSSDSSAPTPFCNS